MFARTLLLAAALAVTATAASAACRNTGSFDRWLKDFKKEAKATGISSRVVDQSLRGVTFSAKIVKHDRRQSVFSQSFLEFSNRMVSGYRRKTGKSLLGKYAHTFAKLERQYGVPGPVITAFWGLETDYGANTGNLPTLTALATLAYDCRRPALFRPQLMAALKVIERGDLKASQMLGAWAGELGQTQLLPSDYYENGIDYNGDGKVNLLTSRLDIIATTANVISKMGWHAGEPWLEEVRVPKSMPWDQADLTIWHPRKQWAKWGVKRRDGKLPRDGVETALLLPMGRNGPAFLAYRNFKVYLNWNQSFIYATTAAYFATRLAGAPARHKGNAPVESLSFNQIKQLQRVLQGRGYDVGGVDGFIGAKTRAAVRSVQAKLGMPTDSYPTPELLRRLGG